MQDKTELFENNRKKEPLPFKKRIFDIIKTKGSQCRQKENFENKKLEDPIDIYIKKLSCIYNLKDGKEKIYELWEELDTLPNLLVKEGIYTESNAKKLTAWLARKGIKDPKNRYPHADNLNAFLSELSEKFTAEGKESLANLWKDATSITHLAFQKNIFNYSDVTKVYKFFFDNQIPAPYSHDDIFNDQTKDLLSQSLKQLQEVEKGNPREKWRKFQSIEKTLKKSLQFEDSKPGFSFWLNKHRVFLSVGKFLKEQNKFENQNKIPQSFDSLFNRCPDNLKKRPSYMEEKQGNVSKVLKTEHTFPTRKCFEESKSEELKSQEIKIEEETRTSLSLTWEELKEKLEKEIIPMIRQKHYIKKSNCAYLAESIIEYFHTGKTPTQPAPNVEFSKEHFEAEVTYDDFELYDSIKLEPVEDTNKARPKAPVNSVVNMNTFFGSRAPGNLAYEVTNNIVDLSKPKIDLTQYTQAKIHWTKADDYLKKLAADNPKDLSYGIICASGLNSESPEIPGHMIIFVATKDKVLYIDPQRFNPRTKIGNAATDRLDKCFNFVRPKDVFSEGKFAGNVFITPMNEYSSALSLKI